MTNFTAENGQVVHPLCAADEDIEVSRPLSEHPFTYTLPALLRRSYYNLVRQPELVSSRITQGLFFSLILCCFYAPIGRDQNSIQDRIGILYEVTPLTFIGMLNNIAIFPLERNVFYREYEDGGYSAFTFLLTYFLLAVPFLVLSSFIISVLLMYAAGLKRSLQGLLSLAYVAGSYMLVGEFIGVAFCSAFYHIGFSVNIMSAVISVFTLFCGYISINMSVVISSINYISPVKWGSRLLAKMVFNGETFTCTDEEKNTAGDCPLSTGDEVLALYGMDGSRGGGGAELSAWLLGGLSIAFVAIGFIAFRLRAFILSH